MVEKKVVSRKPLVGPIQLLKDSWQVFTTHWKQLLIITILPYLSAIPFALIALLVVFLGFYLFSVQNYIALSVLVIVGILFTILYFSVVFTLGTLAVLYRIHERKEQHSIKELLQKARVNLLAYWWVAFLSNILIIGGLILFVVPGVIFTIWFIFGVYIFIAEKKRGMDAIVHSREYVRGYWWKVLGRLLFISSVVWVVSIVPVGILQYLEADGLASIFQLVVSFITTPLMMIYFFLMYESIKHVNPDHSSDTNKQKKLYLVVAFLGLGIMIYLFSLAAQVLVDSFMDLYGPSFTPRTLETDIPPELT